MLRSLRRGAKYTISVVAPWCLHVFLCMTTCIAVEATDDFAGAFVEWKSFSRRVGRMLFLMENAHCATAGDTEQNGAKHFTVARRAIVTCFRRVTIVFAGICKGKLKIVTCFARQTKFYSLFLWRTKHVTISSFPLQMPAKSIVTRLKHVTNARRATRKCQISLSHKPGTMETVRFPRKMLLEQGWTCEKMPLSWKMHRTHH